VDASGLVPGDVVLVRLGDVVPADIKLLGEGGEHDTPMQARAQGAGPGQRVGLWRGVPPGRRARLLPGLVARQTAVYWQPGVCGKQSARLQLVLAGGPYLFQHVECASMSCPI